MTNYTKVIGIILGALLIISSFAVFLISFLIGQSGFVHENMLTAVVGMIGQIGSTYLLFINIDFMKDMWSL